MGWMGDGTRAQSLSWWRAFSAKDVVGKMGFLNLLFHSCCHFEGGDSLIGFALEGYCRCCFLLRNRYLRNLEICQKTCISEPFCGGVQGMMGKKVCFLIVCGIVCCELFSEILIFFLCWMKKKSYFCTRIWEKKERSLTWWCKRSGSSVWLEYMPVTHGVASSSLVRTAKHKEAS